MNPINWHTFLFTVCAMLACGMAISVVVARNVVRMAFFLVLSLAAVSGLFFLAGADFVGGMQLMIYVGGTLVLLIFGVMLTAQGPMLTLQTTPTDWLLSALLGGTLMALLIAAGFSVKSWQTAPGIAPPIDQQVTASRLGMGFLGIRVDKSEQANEALRPGMVGYLMPFEVVAIHLLVVLVGASYLARTKVRANQQPAGGVGIGETGDWGSAGPDRGAL